jgi:Double zinc ribbon
METCPRCRRSVPPGAAFCQSCGTQLHAQPVEGEVIDGRPRFAEARPVDPGRAARLSIVPGLGHWYARAPVRGLAFFVAIVGPLVLGTELDLSVIGLPLGIPMDVGGLGLWVYCAVDAYRTAKRTIGPR